MRNTPSSSLCTQSSPQSLCLSCLSVVCVVSFACQWPCHCRLVASCAPCPSRCQLRQRSVPSPVMNHPPSQSTATPFQGDGEVEAEQFSLARAKMENTRLRHAVSALHRRLNRTTSSTTCAGEDLTMTTNAAMEVSSSPAPAASPRSRPPPTTDTSRGRKRGRGTHTSNDLCKVCAEEPSRKKEILFSGCLHGMCRICMLAHLRARRRSCHVCQTDFHGQLLELGVEVSLKRVLSESDDKTHDTATAACKPRSTEKTN